MDRDYLIKECEFLQNHEVLNHLLDRMRVEAIDAVLDTDPTDYAAIADAQAKANAVDHLRRLIAFNASQSDEKSGFAVV